MSRSHRPHETEEDTKQRYIMPALQHAGWASHQLWMEYSLRSDRFQIVPEQNRTQKISPDSSRNRPDYLLCPHVNTPLAVLEAKRADKTAEDGLDQAINYARILDLPFAYASAGEKFLEFNLCNGKQRTLSMEEFPGPDKLWQMWCEAKGIPAAKRPVMDSALYFTSDDGKIPRYYQLIAINRTVDAVIAHNRRRILLVMATGTGKTYTAFQIVWRLRKAGIAKNVLYLADRNQLIDQTMIGDFAPLEKSLTKISKGTIDQNYTIQFGLYQQLKGADNDEDDGEASFADHFRQVPPDYFDLIIVDECHRGSAREESSWREILEYFSSAVQIGMTATPNRTEGADNAQYFGEPVFTYSLKQGIEDGFLAPFQVVNVRLDSDEQGWTPEPGELDTTGQPIPQRLYTIDDFYDTLILHSRTRAVAQTVTDYLHHIGRMSKTIIFCTNQRHAALMRDAIRQCNSDLVAQEPNYAVRMTADDQDGKALYSDFTSVSEPYPVVVTTSRLLTTGADTKCVKLIVLDSTIRSMTEFKQIIGRGSRLREDADKTFFTILDFRNVTSLFHDPDFDGEAGSTYVWGDGDPLPRPVGGHSGPAAPEPIPPHPEPPLTEPPFDHEPPAIYVVNGKKVSVIGTYVKYADENGNLVTAKFRDYTRRNILRAFNSHAEFLEVWNSEETKAGIRARLEEHGVILEALRKDMNAPDMDDFDLICAVAYKATPLTRQARVSRVVRSKFLEKYQGIAREVLNHLVDIYAHEGIWEIDNTAILKKGTFMDYGGPVKIMDAFGGKDEYRRIVKELEEILYQPVPAPLYQSEVRI